MTIGSCRSPLKDTFKKGRFYFIKTSSPKKLQTVPVLSLSSRLVSLQNKTTESPATSPYCHHVATDRVEEFFPLCAVASSNGALPTPSRLSESYLYHFVSDMGRKQRTSRRRTRYEHRHIGMDYVVSRVRRSRFGVAFCCFFKWRKSARRRPPAVSMAAGISPVTAQ